MCNVHGTCARRHGGAGGKRALWWRERSVENLDLETMSPETRREDDEKGCTGFCGEDIFVVK